MANQNKFRVALTADLFDCEGNIKGIGTGLSVFAGQPHIECFTLEEDRPQIGADQLEGVQGVLVWAPSVQAETVSRSENLLAISRLGVGYDKVDVQACTEADVAVFITKGAVDRSMAEATVGWMLGLTHRVLIKDRLVRNGQWAESFNCIGQELRDRTFGSVGMGGIAREAIRLLSIFGMNRPLAFDPYLDASAGKDLGVDMVNLDDLMKRADFVSIHCPLTDQTRGLIGQRQLALMKPNAYLINTARGGIVDEDALYDVLKSKQIAGAAIDTFVGEPITAPHRFGQFDNVMLAPHAIGVTDELLRDLGDAASQAVLDLSLGRKPQRGIVNPEVFDRPGFQKKWERLRDR